MEKLKKIMKRLNDILTPRCLTEEVCYECEREKRILQSFVNLNVQNVEHFMK